MTMASLLNPVLLYAHHLLQQHVQTGDGVLDGTAGNGHDTLCLAQCVGETGKVWAFDIQDAAIRATKQRLDHAGVSERVELIQAGHQDAANYVPHGITAAIFNFGYLPKGDKNITTQADTSVMALQTALSLLRTGGLLLAVVYSGHPAGVIEAQHIEAWASALPQHDYRVLRYQFINQRNAPPFLLAIEKII